MERNGTVPAYHLRSATDEDVLRLFEIHRAAMHDYVDRVWGWDDADQEERFRDYLRTSDVQVIEVAGEVAGFVHIVSTPDGITIANIEVAPAYQNHGIGSDVMQRTLARAREEGVPVTLRVLKVNPEARRLYDSLGFVHVGETATHDLLRIDPQS
jgi:ribosomal protein S18 acetylase RimI-like enzyme